jgi:tetratricopeptide (TPR) repeat protein
MLDDTILTTQPENKSHEDDLLDEVETLDHDPSNWLMPPDKEDNITVWLDETIRKQSPEALKSYQERMDRALLAYKTAEKLFAQRHFQQAVISYNVAIDIKQDYLEAYSSRGATHLALGNHQLALDDASKATKLNSQYAMAYYVRGAANYALGDIGLAQNDLIVAAQLFQKQNNSKEFSRIIKLLGEIESLSA